MVCHSWEQSLSIQALIWKLLPKDLIDPETQYTPGRGFRGKVPIVRFKPQGTASAGSVLRVKTTNQGSLGVASASVSYVQIDEPPPRGLWGEVAARGLRAGPHGGRGLSLTPVGRPCDWIQDLCESGIVSDTQAPLTVPNVTPQGGRPMLTEDQIEDIAARYLPMDRPQRLLGEWVGPVEDRTFTAFEDDAISTDRPTPGWKWEIGIGIAHGADAGSQVAILVAVFKGHKDKRPRVHVLDEYTSGGEAVEPGRHARAILGMLRRNGMTHNSVDRWVGDRKYGGKRHGGKMGNSRLMRAFEVELGLPRGELPFTLRTAHKPRGSIYEGCSILHECMIRKNFTIHPRCQQVVRSLREFRFRDDSSKHAIDALRYGAVELLTRRVYAPDKLTMY